MKALTMSEFRKQPGEYLREVMRHGASFLLTKAGRPAARLLPPGDDGDTTEILSDGTVRGPRPLTWRCPMGG